MHNSRRYSIPLAGAVGAVLAILAGGIFAAAPGLPEDLSSYRHIHSFVVTDEENPLFGFHHFYANQPALRGLADGGPYADGAMFLGAVYQVEQDGGQVNEGSGAAYTLMLKDSSATETGGWRFAQYRADGAYIEQDEKSACFQCHTRVSDRDYVFSQPLESLRLPPAP